MLSSLLTACNLQSKTNTDVKYAEHMDQIMGVSLQLPEKELNDWTVLYGPYDQSIDRGKYAPVDGSYLSFMPMESGITLFNIEYYEESKWNSWLKEGHKADEITGTPNSKEIGRKDGMVYVYSEPNPNEKGMSDELKQKYEMVLKMLPTIRKSITLTTRGASDTGTFPSFSTTDLAGNVVDSNTFSNYQITMVNIWGTFCGPCIEEMPDLEKLSKEMPQGTRLVGLVCDALDDEHKSLAKKILSEKGVSYANWIPDESLKKYMDDHISGVPTTLFIDQNGQIIGDALIGSQSIKEYQSQLESRLNSTTIKSPSKIDLSGNVSFSAQTPFGDAIDSSIFADYNLTMINVWGTLCKPCIEEMPEIQKLYEEMKSNGVNIIGFVANYQDDRVEKAKQILNELKITYPNVVFDDATSDAITSQVAGYPTTLFVDSNGNIIGKQIAGAHSYAEYKSIIEQRLGETGR